MRFLTFSLLLPAVLAIPQRTAGPALNTCPGANDGLVAYKAPCAANVDCTPSQAEAEQKCYNAQWGAVTRRYSAPDKSVSSSESFSYSR